MIPYKIFQPQYLFNYLVLQVSKIQLSERETKIVQQAFQTAYQRETSALINYVRDRSTSLKELDDLWSLHDLLSSKRYEIDGKYEFNDSTFMFDFASLIKEGWLTLEDLKGLNSDVLSKISALKRM